MCQSRSILALVTARELGQVSVVISLPGGMSTIVISMTVTEALTFCDKTLWTRQTQLWG